MFELFFYLWAQAGPPAAQPVSASRPRVRRVTVLGAPIISRASTPKQGVERFLQALARLDSVEDESERRAILAPTLVMKGDPKPAASPRSSGDSTQAAFAKAAQNAEISLISELGLTWRVFKKEARRGDKATVEVEFAGRMLAPPRAVGKFELENQNGDWKVASGPIFPSNIKVRMFTGPLPYAARPGEPTWKRDCSKEPIPAKPLVGHIGPYRFQGGLNYSVQAMSISLSCNNDEQGGVWFTSFSNGILMQPGKTYLLPRDFPRSNLTVAYPDWEGKLVTLVINPSKYTGRLEVGRPTRGKEGKCKLYLCLDDDFQSFLAGEFSADIDPTQR